MKLKMYQDKVLRLFFSVDIIGSTAFKYEEKNEWGNPRRIGKISPDWILFFVNFFERFPHYFIEQSEKPKDLVKGSKSFVRKAYHKPSLWKEMGDELIFFVQVTDTAYVPSYIKNFANSVEGFIKHYSQTINIANLSFKGTCWLASFPIYNRVISFVKKKNDERILDFIGPSMDIGFRLREKATNKQLIISADLAFVLSSYKESCPIYYNDGALLKGVNGGVPYPIFWINLDEERLKLSNPCRAQNIVKYYRDHLMKMGEVFTMPYLSNDSKFNKKPDDYDEKFNEACAINEIFNTNYNNLKGRTPYEERNLRDIKAIKNTLHLLSKL